MAVHGFMTMTRAGQPFLPAGGKKRSPYMNASEVHAFEYSVETQFDSNQGSPVGRRRHKPIVITKEFDAASPLLLNASWTDEIIDEVKLEIVETGPRGGERVVNRITITNAQIVTVRTWWDFVQRKRVDRIELDFEDVKTFWPVRRWPA